MTVHALSWPQSRLGEGIAELCRRAGLRAQAGNLAESPDDSCRDDPTELARWIAWAGERLGVEARPVESTAAGMAALLEQGGPAILKASDDGEGHFFLLLPRRFGGLRLLAPDLRVRTCAVEDLRDTLCASLEAPIASEIDHLLDLARIAPGQRLKVRRVIALERLAGQRIGECWLLQLPPSTSFWRQLRQARVPRKLGAMLGAFALVYLLEIFGWTLIGDAALNGRLDLGWLAAWLLLVFTIVPVSLVGGWFDSMLALDVSRLLKTRLLQGALQLDVETVRHQGAGQLLGRVMEAEAFEGLALNGGLGVFVAVVELAFAAWVLSLGPSGALHLVLLLGWLGLSLALGLRHFRHLGDWTRKRLAMTHELVERMVGHRTTLAQEVPARRDLHEDRSMKDYLGLSSRMDRSVIPFIAGVPSGWMLVGLAGLAPTFVSGNGTPVDLAIGLGGVLLANRAFTGIASGLSAAARAAMAWQQVSPLFRAAGRTPPELPFMPLKKMQGQPADGGYAKVIDADGLSYRYQAAGEPALKSVSLVIRHGERLLLEGGSGGGKSTLASLLTGLRVPQSGMLLLNGLDRFTLGESWHEFATEAPQFQENHILSGTLGFNLLMGRNWPATEDELEEARALCVELGLGDLLQRMPSGMMQMIGETGWQLSHGERSRIFLARALLQDAQMTILDESFAALDPETLEKCLDCAFRRARTLVVIAHP
ncbi:MAG: ABC transporter ATP-binding protein [Reyranellaceae bacterium]